MATVSTYLVVIASGVVRDVYLQFLRPHAGQTEIRRVSQGVMIFFGLLSFALNIYPVKVFAGPGRVQHFDHRGHAVGAGRHGGLLAAGDGAGAIAAMFVWLGDDAVAVRHRLGVRVLRL